MDSIFNLSDEQEIDSMEMVNFRREVYKWCYRNADYNFKQKDYESTLQWDSLAAYIASKDCFMLVSQEIEAHLIKIAKQLPIPVTLSNNLKHGRTCWLHVVTVALPHGGHTAMLKRWIELDSDQSKHCVIVLEQKSNVPSSLHDVAEMSGGEVVKLDPETSLIDRAIQLRQYAWQNADVVVLHVYPYDVISSVAFGIPGGPSVMFVNHAAHVFWLGVSVTDLLLNCRSSTQEDEWAITYRGFSIDRNMTLPIPLSDSYMRYESLDRAKDRAKSARLDLQLPEYSKVILTVGDTFKYTPMTGLDFVEAAKTILDARPDAYLLAVGIDEDPRWLAAKESTGGRLRAVGKQYNLEPFHAAADVYIEGFPFGSTTALLEAGLQGIPCVLSPCQCPSPFASDGVALEVLSKPTDVAAYVERVLFLLDNEYESSRCGKELAKSIGKHHSPIGWRKYLEAVRHKLPRCHEIHSLPKVPFVPKGIAAYWGNFSSLSKEDHFVETFRMALHRKLRTRVDKNLKIAINVVTKAKKLNPVVSRLILFTDYVNSLMPIITYTRFWSDYIFKLSRNDGFIMRITTRLNQRCNNN